MELNTQRLLLKIVELKDLDDIHRLNSIPETDQYNTLGLPDSIDTTRLYLMDWINCCEETPPSKYIFSVFLHDLTFIGMLGINIGKQKYKSAELWYKLNLNFWNQGYATELVFASLDFCFYTLCMHRVEAGCATENVASRRVLEKVGMKLEGTMRAKLPIRGEWKDGYFFAILENEYKKK